MDIDEEIQFFLEEKRKHNVEIRKDEELFLGTLNGTNTSDESPIKIKAPKNKEKKKKKHSEKALGQTDLNNVDQFKTLNKTDTSDESPIKIKAPKNNEKKKKKDSEKALGQTDLKNAFLEEKRKHNIEIRKDEELFLGTLNETNTTSDESPIKILDCVKAPKNNEKKKKKHSEKALGQTDLRNVDQFKKKIKKMLKHEQSKGAFGKTKKQRIAMQRQLKKIAKKNKLPKSKRQKEAVLDSEVTSEVIIINDSPSKNGHSPSNQIPKIMKQKTSPKSKVASKSPGVVQKGPFFQDYKSNRQTEDTEQNSMIINQRNSPTDMIVDIISKMPSYFKIADIGGVQGDLSQRVSHLYLIQVFSLVFTRKGFVALDARMAPLLSGAVDAAVCRFYTLHGDIDIGTDSSSYFIEINRILVLGGQLLVIGTTDQMNTAARSFHWDIERVGFKLISLNLDDKEYTSLQFVKIRAPPSRTAATTKTTTKKDDGKKQTSEKKDTLFSF